MVKKTNTRNSADASAKRLLIQPEILEAVIAELIDEAEDADTSEIRRAIRGMKYNVFSGNGKLVNSDYYVNGRNRYLDRVMVIRLKGILIIIDMEPQGQRIGNKERRTAAYIATLINEQKLDKNYDLQKIYLIWINMDPEKEYQGKVYCSSYAQLNKYDPQDYMVLKEADKLPKIINVNLFKTETAYDEASVRACPSRSVRILSAVFSNTISEEKREENLAMEGIQLTAKTKGMIRDMDSIKELSIQTGIKKGIQQGREKERKIQMKKMTHKVVSLMRLTDLDDEKIHEIFPEYSVEQLSELRKKMK